MNIGELTATLGCDATGLQLATREMESFEKRMKNQVTAINTQLKSAGDSMKKFGRSASTYITLPLTLAGGASFKMYKDFDSNMSKITGLVGVAREQVNAWRDDVVAMAPVVGKSASELSNALFFITSAGIRGSEAMEVLEMSAKAATAGLGDTTTVADLATSAMNAYGIANLSAEKAVDILVATVREGKAVPEELAQSMGQVLPIAAEMKVSFNEVGAMMAAMTRTGTNAATAATQLRQILASLLKPTKMAEDALKGMNTSSAELRKTIKERGLLTAMMDIKDLTKEYGEEIMARVFPNIRALSGILDVMGSNLEDNKKIFQSMSDTTNTLNMAFEEATNTVEFKYNQAIVKAKTGLTVFGETVSTAAIPLIQQFGNTVENLTKWFKNLDDSSKLMIVRIGGLAAAVGPLSIALGFLVGNVLPGLIKVGYGAVKMFNALRLAMIKNPITAIAVGLAAVAATMIKFNGIARETVTTQTALNNLQTTANQNIVEQKTEVEKLLRVIDNENSTLNQKESAIRKLNQISPEYLGNIDLEKIKTGEARLAIEAYISSLREQAKVQAASQLMIEAEKQRIEDLAKGYDRQQSSRQKWNNALLDIISRESYASLKAKTEEENARKATEDHANIMKYYEGVINGTIGKEKDLAKQFEFTKVQMESIKTVQGEALKHIKTRVDESIKSEQKYTTGLKTQLQERLKQDQQLLNLQTQYEEAARNNADKIYLGSLGMRIQTRKETLAAELDQEYKANQQRLKMYETFQAQIEERMKKTGVTTTTGTGGGSGVVSPEVGELLKQLAAEEENIRKMNEVLGNSFDSTKARIDLYQFALQELIKAGLQPTDLAVKDLAGKLKEIQSTEFNLAVYNAAAQDAKNYTNQLTQEMDALIAKENSMKTADDIFLEMDVALASATVNAKRFGEAFDLTNTQIQIYTQALQALQSIDGPFTEEDQAMLDSVIQKLKDLGYEFEKTDKTMKSSVQGVYQLSAALSQAGSAIGGVAGNWTSWAASVIRDIPKIIAGITALSAATSAETAADSGAAVAKATKEGAKMPFPANLIAIATGVAAVLAALASIPKAKKAAKMEKGGTVPAGFPNDSYPAMLTSGETVVPPGDLPDLNNRDQLRALNQIVSLLKVINNRVGMLSQKTSGLNVEATSFGMMSVMQKIKIAKLAKGGTIPPGYPNDSYPALLSSGERVLPAPGKLNFERPKIVVNLHGEWRLTNRDIYFMVREEERIRQNSY